MDVSINHYENETPAKSCWFDRWSCIFKSFRWESLAAPRGTVEPEHPDRPTRYDALATFLGTRALQFNK